MKIQIISASVRIDRNSHRVALYLQRFINDNGYAAADILDLATYRFRVFEERLQYLKNPEPEILQFASAVEHADGVIIVTPEYNGGYPASIKNAIDLLYTQWKKKPIGIATVSDGIFGGTQVITSLLFTLWKIGAFMVPATFPVPDADKEFDDNGVPKNAVAVDKRAHVFIREMLWCMEAKKRMEPGDVSV